eukprot:CAMPEP_0117071998 /NCGR_PEP_ID=MMETSP0472-20121206/50636_1 /TAXON_ID=693140 ORGANISM="Tiarina fusus, Strain LIS" /NCGR_SAMPLE_ID=MMETSP0472 /ASSEMBLY_ACC=CAM_ASM_000603 /LENGTH=111 /DNA_ID=CAMNT_0004795843 /DNA_START=260 /DNA_END=595 /DNA_ORIENTATION=-
MTAFGLLKEFTHSFFTADFNFAEEAEEGIFPPEFLDCWPNVNKGEPGFTFDDENPVRHDMPDGKRRIDRVLVRSSTWNPIEAKLLGNEVFIEDNPELRPSDHYGVAVTLSR